MTDPTDLAAHIRRVFGRYADSPIWVAWQARPNGEKDPIKVPINPHTGYPASTTDPKSWAPMGKALAAAQRGNLAGIGIMLGPDPSQNPDGDHDKPFIVGVDYDNALRADGSLTSWAEEHLLVGTYTEVSPSGTGIKAFALVDGRPEGLPQDRDGTKLRLGDIAAAVDNGKRPAVEVYTNRRWFAVTGRTFRGTDTDGIKDMSRRLPVLLRHATPAPSLAGPSAPVNPDDSITAQDARDAHAAALSDTERQTLTNTLNAHASLAQAVVGSDWADRSGALFTAADLCKGYSLSFNQFVHAIMAATGAAGEHVRSQPDPYRALARAWDRSPQPLPVAPPGPVGDNPQMGDRPGVKGEALGAYTQITDLSFLDTPNPLGTPYIPPEDLFSNPPPRPAFVLPGLFPASPTAIVGTGGVMKSTIWMAMALNMHLTRPIWGRTWWEGGASLMVSSEDEIGIMNSRLSDLIHGMNVTDRQYRALRHKFYMDDMTGVSSQLVASDGKGNLAMTQMVDHLIDKYADRGVAFAAIDPMVNFGPGETHGNDGAALMMKVGWRLVRGWSGEGRTSLAFIHHISAMNAREEVEDQHAGRGASAIGDNARSVWVMHRHKVQNPNRHVAPPSIPAEAIERGDVIRMKMAKNSYARLVAEPFWVWRDQGGFHFVEPLSTAEAQAASAALPTEAEQARNERDQAAYDRIRAWFPEQINPFTRESAKALLTSTAAEKRMFDQAWTQFVQDNQIVSTSVLTPNQFRFAGNAAPTNQPRTAYGF